MSDKERELLLALAKEAKRKATTSQDYCYWHDLITAVITASKLEEMESHR